MSQTTLRRPAPYRPGLWTRLLEGLRYGGGIGQWSWLVHRLTGLGILLYLVVHIVDTFFVVVSPAMYDHALDLYGGWVGGGYYWPIRWAFRFGELGVFACVLFHSLNGLRVVAFDFWPRAVNYQRDLFRAVVAVFLVVMLFAGAWILWPLRKAPPPRPGHGAEPPVQRVVQAGTNR
jgi:succinate dehydrogenase / fumarate reductase cytochrome b subunit